jgi:L-cysteine desulfidase
MNLRLADYGLRHQAGMGVGRALDGLLQKGWLCSDPLLSARKLTAAAADARMSGADLPAMSSAGSGNNGLTAMLPVWAVQQWADADKRLFLEGVCLSHLVTGLIKAHIGRLSALCSCSIAAGAGASAGIVHLLGGRRADIATAVVNLLEDLAGVFCDGAKPACALKLSTAAGSAVQSAMLALSGVAVSPIEGIAGADAEEAIRHLGRISREGTSELSSALLRIMLGKLEPKP